MAIRDLLLFAVVFGALPFVFKRPWIGVILWVWVSLMNPHRLSWGVAYDFPFAQLIGIATIIGMFFSSEPVRRKGGAAAVLLLAFLIWVCITTIFALAKPEATLMLERVLKIQLFTFIALLTLSTRKHVIALVWVIALSIGFYSVKGGAFTIATGGQYRVWGPPDTFIGDNNALAVAVVMTIPLWIYLFRLHTNRWMRLAIAVAAILSTASAFGSQSRGALLAICATAFILWLRSRTRLVSALVVIVVGTVFVSFMPDTWSQRMASISATEDTRDMSSKGRLDAWSMLTKLALDRPVVGGGFEPYRREIWDKYHPEYDRPYSAHSIYFSVLGEHGFVGLLLFLAFWIATMGATAGLVREAAARPEHEWATSLAHLSQASLVGYFIGGAFLDLAYWDGPYYVMVAIVVARFAVQEEKAKTSSIKASSLSAPIAVTQR